MSVRVLSWVLDNSEAPGNDRLVLIAIADEADDDGTNSYPSIDRIARRARVNKRTTMRALERLEETGELVVQRPEVQGRGHHNRYGVVMGRDPEEVLALVQKGDTLAGSAVEERRGKARKGAPMSAPDPQTHEPVGDPSAEPSVSPFLEDAQRLCELLADLIARDGSKRPSVTGRWVEEAERMLRLDGRDPVKAERLLRWCQDDTFWRANILSMPKFREKYDQLRKRANAEREQQGGPRAPIDQDRDRPSGAIDPAEAARIANEGRAS